LVSAGVAFGAGVTLLDGDKYATGEAFPAVLGVALTIASIAVLGVGIGTAIRHSAGAVVALVGVVLLPGLLAPLFGDAQRWVGGASFTGVMEKMTQSSDATHQTVGSLGAWSSLAVVVAYTTATMLAAVWVLRRRNT